MKFLTLITFLFVTLLTSCDIEDPGLQMNHDYHFEFEDYETRNIFSKRITFFEDGTYSRTEDVAFQFWESFTDLRRSAVYIDDLRGIWVIQDGAIYLSDLKIESMQCYETNGTYVDCPPDKEKLSFGTLEWFNHFKVLDVKSDNVVLGTSLKY